MTNKTPPTWEDLVTTALGLNGGSAPLSDLYTTVEALARENGRPLPKHYRAKVRQVCQLSRLIAPGETRGTWRLVD